MGFLGVEKMGVALAVILLCGFVVTAAHEGCSHGHHHHHDHDHEDQTIRRRTLLPEELAEEEDLKLLRFGGGDHHHHDDDDHHHDVVADAADLSGLGLWIHAMGCSLLVSLASLICLIFLPIIFVRGKPSKAVVDSLALFGAGAMLGDAFLHQLPHAFGGEHSHSHDHNLDHPHLHDHLGHENPQSHAHSLKDLSVGLCILAGIILFLLVEKLVRYVEDSSGKVSAWSHGHHHHHHHRQHKSAKLKADNDANENPQGSEDNKHEISEEAESKGKVLDGGPVHNLTEENHHATLRKRNPGEGAPENNSVTENEIIASDSINESEPKEEAKSSNLVFGYLNLFSDGVHNFTDGIALGSAFLLYGSVGGWSRTLFLLAHELPQEIGDFGILVRSGFSVSAALFFNFLSALVALAGTAVALMWGQDPGQSSLIEGFTAGGFIYIAIAVLAEMNSGRSTLKSGAIHVVSLVAGMAVALCISLVE